MVIRNQNVNQREQTSYQQQRDASIVVSPPSAQRRQSRVRNEEHEGVNRARSQQRVNEVSDLTSRYDEIPRITMMNANADRETLRAIRPNTQDPFTAGDGTEDMPELEEVPRQWSRNQLPPEVNDPNAWFNLPIGNFEEFKRDFSPQAIQIIKEAIADGASFTPFKINQFTSQSEALQAMVSLAVHRMMTESGVEITNSLLANPGRIVCLPMGTISSIIKRLDQARVWFKKMHSIDPVSPNLNDVTPLYVKQLVGKSYQMLSSATPPTEECIKVLKLILKRYHPDDVEKIEEAMQRAELVPATFVRFIKQQGELAKWIQREMGEELLSFVPRIYRLTRLQEEVDEEENARLEELSIGRSVSSFPIQEPEAATEGEMVAGGGDKVHLSTQRNEQAEDTAFDHDLDPLDPMSTLVNHAERNGSDVLISKTLLRDLACRQDFEIYQYEFDDVPEASPAFEVGFPSEAFDYQYAGVTESEAKKTLCDTVLEPYFNRHFPEAATILKWHYGKTSHQELSLLCGAPSQLKVSIKGLDLVICSPPKKTKSRESVSLLMDPVYALPKLPMRSILQIELSENADPASLVEQLGSYFESLSPGQEAGVEESWEVLLNLSEASIGTENEPKTIRVLIGSSFDMKEFFRISRRREQLRGDTSQNYTPRPKDRDHQFIPKHVGGSGNFS
jgi:hypothetical protein